MSRTYVPDCMKDLSHLNAPHRPGLRVLALDVENEPHKFLICYVIPTVTLATVAVYVFKRFCWGCPQEKDLVANCLFDKDGKTLCSPVAFQGCDNVVTLTLAEKHPVTYDTRRFIFDLPSPYHRLGVPIGREVVLVAVTECSCVSRQYIPINLDHEIGRLEIIVKVYVDDPSKGMPGGQMTQFLDNMKIGDCIDAQGPSGHLWEYTGRGRLNVFSQTHKITFAKRAKEIGLVAGGAGITPFLRLIRYCETEGQDSPRLSLVFANKSNLDIIERQYLERLSKSNPGKFQLYMCVDLEPVEEDWCQGVGRVSCEMIQKYLPEPSLDSFVMVSGPTGFINHSMDLLSHVGYTENRVLALCSS